jgi:hypothetical protein
VAASPDDAAASATQAKAGHATSLLDARAARLLASLGIAPTGEADYLLVSDDAAAAASSSRWVVAGAMEQAA